ncbi:hypothetical protein VOLCADRAFT_107070 [Volvox carteri f. nagariensis]|uniref:Uncharacterized protein n=1 Tax=Volvox carteri f. nagariensis TaxID=3068 RepID=D8UBT6_VOLCA|nr:uncharacterized protein VOLCADRAFT_107070 [Volvox carteri f. nagariensis]EFJ42823.1 hypothetical protein VOLCADRAFT_107070 [Volvox carteri f. nagariensis]|eukprot:XP_002956083.1 hypothetical protein VOLCADRAFT_107070 [Volvox carteri f. nagariensis]
MRVIQRRGWLTGVGQAFRKPDRHFGVNVNAAELEVQAKNVGAQPDPDVAFLQLLSQSFGQGSSPRPLLANIPAAAELMGNAVLQSPSPQPLYDLPTFLETAYPQASVQPRNPGYDWRIWARKNLTLESLSASAKTDDQQRPQQQQQQREDLLALLLQTDAHMQLPASRQELLRIAKLELTHLWYYQQQQQQQLQQQQQQQQQGRRVGAVSPLEGARSNGPNGAQSSSSAAAAASALSGNEGSLGSSQQGQQQPHQQLQQGEGGGGAAAAGGGPPGVAVTAGPLPPSAAASAAGRKLRLRELQRRAEAYGQLRTGSLAATLRNVGEAFGQRVSYGKNAYGDGGAGADGAAKTAIATQMAFSVGAGATHAAALRQTANAAADTQLLGADAKSTSSLSYWVEHPLLSYGDNILALAVRRNATRRLESSSGSDGKASLAAAVASLSSSLPRQVQDAAGPPATPVLSLLLDYLKVKYLDVLHACPHYELWQRVCMIMYVYTFRCWLAIALSREVAEQLHAATERVHREKARQQATMTVQVSELLPATVRDELSRTWAQAAASFRPEVLDPLLQQPVPVAAAEATGAGPSAAATAWEQLQRTTAQQTLLTPLDWKEAEVMLSDIAARRDATLSAPGNGGNDSAASISGDNLRTAVVQRALAPVLAAAIARHQALLRGPHGSGDIGGGALSASTASTASTTMSTTSAASASESSAAALPSASRSAATVVCFRETLVLDASSAFEDSSHDCRVSLEFDIDRLAASEPGLGGAWGARFLERLLALPTWPASRRMPGGSMAGRARRGASARSALMAAAYPVDVEASFCRRTRTAMLTTARYPSREANRKLLLERYTELLRAATQAVAGAAPAAAGSPVMTGQ